MHTRRELHGHGQLLHQHDAVEALRGEVVGPEQSRALAQIFQHLVVEHGRHAPCIARIHTFGRTGAAKNDSATHGCGGSSMGDYAYVQVK